MDNPKNTKPAKPKYSMWQCVGFMLATARRERELASPLLGLVIALATVGSNLVGLYLPPAVVDAVERGVSPGRLLATVALFVLGAMACAALRTYAVENQLFPNITIRSSILNMLNHKLGRTSYPNLSDGKLLALVSKARQACLGNSEASEAVWDTLTELTQNLAGFAVYLALLSTLKLWLVALVLATAVLGYLVNRELSGYAYRHREEEAALSQAITYHVDRAKDTSFTKDIRLFHLRPWLEEVVDKAMTAYRAFQWNVGTRQLWGEVLDLVLAFLRNGAAYAYLIGLVLAGKLTAAQFLLYFSAVGGFSAWVVGILTQLTILYRQSLDLSVIREVLDYPEPFTFEEGRPLTVRREDRHTLTLENVSFRYPGAAEDTLNHIDLTLHPGEKLAVVGLNGAGKTTLVKLLCGFLDPTEGRVLLDGQDIRQFNRRDYYALFAAVFQDFSLMAASVASNVAQEPERAKIDMDRVRTCIAQAGLTEKIESLPGGCDALLERSVYNDGVQLSGGQVQRLMLARALYKDAPFILLDEPTAALDPIAEADLYEKYAEMTQGCSSVYISHRMASTRFCDRVLFLADHRIAEEGTHESLLALGGQYAQLFEIQSKYYRKEAVGHEED